jgi:integrase
MVLRAMLNHAYATGRIENKSAWERIKGFAPAPMPRQRFLTVEECQRLLRACQPDLRVLIEVGLLTGCRFGEVKRLRVHDFIAESGKLFIHMTKRSRSRTVTLTARGVELFTRQIVGRHPDDYMLAPANAERWLAHRYYSRMQRTAERVDIPPPVNYQVLRRTYASHAAMAGLPLLVIANQMGHVNTRTLEQHYAQLSATYVDGVIRKSMPDLA